MSHLNEAILSLRACIRARIPILLWGAPGVGKTAIVEQIAEELGAGYVPVAVATRLAEDFSGLPVPREDGIVQEPLSWVRRAIALANKQMGGCIVLLDEFSCAPASTQAALLSLVQSRYCGETMIPRNVAFVAAANPVDQAADGWELPAPTVSRWIHIDWPVPSVDEWTEWLTTKSVKPSDVGTPWAGKAGSNARALVAGYLNRSQSSLNGEYKADVGNRSEPYPCPRAWEHAARLITVAPNETVRDTLIAGAVGNGIAAEFSGWLRDADLPDPEKLLAKPMEWEMMHGRADHTLATLLRVAAAVTHKPTQERYDAAVLLCCRVLDGGMPGVAVIAVHALIASDKIRGLKTPADLRRFSDVASVARTLGLVS